jgi:hypothetical protein
MPTFLATVVMRKSFDAMIRFRFLARWISCSIRTPVLMACRGRKYQRCSSARLDVRIGDRIVHFNALDLQHFRLL